MRAFSSRIVKTLCSVEEDNTKANSEPSGLKQAAPGICLLFLSGP